MRTRAFIASLVAAGVLAPAAGADAPIRQSFTLTDVTFPDSYLSGPAAPQF